jgi:hypothetical protein
MKLNGSLSEAEVGTHIGPSTQDSKKKLAVYFYAAPTTSDIQQPCKYQVYLAPAASASLFSASR